MGSRYKVGDEVEIFGRSPFIKGRRHIVSKGIGTVAEIRGGGHYADYTERRLYIIQLHNRQRMCRTKELRLIKRAG